MTAPRIVRCIDCDRPVAIYGDDDEAPICAACADKEPVLPLPEPAREERTN